MNLTSPSQVKSWCIENGFHPNRTMGQNFLIDRNALIAIVDAGLSGAEKGANVLEIGPGLGVLTEELLARGCAVTAIEKDPVLAARLADALGNPPGLTVIEGDALHLLSHKSTIPHSSNPPLLHSPTPPLPHSSTPPIPQSHNSIIPQFHNFPVSPAFTHMVSNLPYQAGTRILMELVLARAVPSMTVLVQTEVAERIAAPEGSKTRSLTGVWAQLDYDVKIVRKVSPACFWPRPEVGSSVITLTCHERNIALSEEERKIFHNITKRAFAHRRKQLGTIFKDLVKSTARAEELSIEDWIKLVKGIKENEDT